MTHNSLRMVIVGQTLPPKIVIIKQSGFIFMVLHGSYTYFCGPIKEFYKDFFSTDQGKIFTKLRLVIFTRLQQ